MYGWFPRQQQNDPQNEPQSPELGIKTIEKEKWSREEISKWNTLKRTMGASESTFGNALEFFKNNPCKYIVSIHGSQPDTQEYEMANLFKSYDENKKKRIIKFLFPEQQQYNYIEYKEWSKGNPIVIFYNKKHINSLVEKMNNGVYNGPISKYIVENDDYKIKKHVDIDENVNDYFKNILDLPFIWRTTIEWKNNIKEILHVISTQILFGNVTCSGNPHLHCGWSSGKKDRQIVLS